MSLVECRALTRVYRRGENTITPLDALDLEIGSGAFLALMGPSGSGKTTLLNLIAGIDRPTQGELLVGGVDIARLSRARLAAWRGRTIGYIFQLYHLVPVLTAYENVELPLLIQPLTRKERHQRVARALELSGIDDRHDHYPRQLSGGQEQRVAIARAIVADAPILLADEPTGDLDRQSSLGVLELLGHLNENLGKTIVVVTHDPATAARAHQTLHLEKGRLVDSAGEPAPARGDPR